MLVIIDVPEEVKKLIQGSGFPEELKKYSDVMMEKFIKSIIAKDIVKLFGRVDPKVAEWCSSLIEKDEEAKKMDLEVMQAALNKLKEDMKK